jgi:putative PEP-CTERM system histidine kinase
METNEIATIGYTAGMLGFAVLSALFLGRWKGGPYSWCLGLACGASAVWGCVLTLQSLGYVTMGALVVLTEWLRSVLWIVAFFMVLRKLDSRRLAEGFLRRFGLPVIAVSLLLLVIYSSSHLDSLALSLIVSGGIVMALILISLLEQIYRNLPSDSTSSLKYICVALLVVYAYDIIFFVRAITGGSIEADPWAARGYINALVIVPLALSGRRSALEAAADIPRQVVFYSFALLATGVSVVLWLTTDYYLRVYGGSWGNVASIVLGAAALCTLGFLLVSATIRARARVFLTKTFFQYKYDYRKEWLRFIATLSEPGLEHVPTTSVRAVAPIVNSPGGIVWVREHEGNEYLPVGSWRCELPVGKSFDRDSSLVRFLRDRRWVIDLNELKSSPSLYGELQLDPWFAERDDLWLVVPMLIGKRLFGFIVLLKPRMVPTLNFEDHDLLKTVGSHVGTHLKQAESDKRLAESSQFGTYHRLSAFLMHDLNNLIAQQSLVVKNAEKFRHDPRFVDDTIDTIAHSVARMRRLMEQLSSDSKTPKSSRVSIREVLEKAVRRSEPREPAPALSFDGDDLLVKADPERLTVVIEHLIRNAQDATDRDGAVRVIVSSSNEVVTIAITDTGCGMTPEFISERLFRPFDSTKGSQSMGIGAYQAREYVRMLRGQLEVKSGVGQGTTFSLRLPVVE